MSVVWTCRRLAAALPEQGATDARRILRRAMTAAVAATPPGRDRTWLAYLASDLTAPRIAPPAPEAVLLLGELAPRLTPEEKETIHRALAAPASSPRRRPW